MFSVKISNPGRDSNDRQTQNVNVEPGRRVLAWYRRWAITFVVTLLVLLVVSLSTPLVGIVGKHRRISEDLDTKPPAWIGHYNWNLANECPTNWDSDAWSSNFESSSTRFNRDSSLFGTVHDNNPIQWNFNTGALLTSSMTFNLNASALSHLLVSHNTCGKVLFIPDGKVNTISVEVIAHYSRSGDLGRAKVCKIQNENGGEGVGIYVNGLQRIKSTSTECNPRDVSFTLLVHLPGDRKHPTDPSPILINAFETDLPLFSHRFRGLSQDVRFRDLKVRSSNAAITTEDKGLYELATIIAYNKLDVKTTNGAIWGSFYSPKLDVGSSNAPISGSFGSNNTMQIRTSNGPINVQTQLIYQNRTTTRDYPYMELKTTNSEIVASNSLLNFVSKSGGGFEITATTSNGLVKLDFPHSPHTSMLELSSTTTNAPQNIYLNSAFEGKINLGTSASLGTDAFDTDWERLPQDPSGQKRYRIWSLSSARDGQMSGVAAWGKWNGTRTDYGKLLVRTTNAKVTLKAELGE